MRRRYSIESGVLFDINRHSIQNKILIGKSQTIHPSHNLKHSPTRKQVYYDQTGVINKPELKNTVEIDGIELNFMKSYNRTKSKVDQTIDHQSAYSFEENFSVHSQEIDEENEEFFFERDNENNLIEILEQKIQNDILNHEKKRKKDQIQSGFFSTVKLNETESKSQGEGKPEQGYFKKYSVDNILKNCKTDNVKIDIQIEENHPIQEENQGDHPGTGNEANQENYEDMNEVVDNFIDLDQLDQGTSRQGSKLEERQENSKVERSEEQSQTDPNLNKTEEVVFDTISRRMNFDVIKID
jgi:hypothetical protein